MPLGTSKTCKLTALGPITTATRENVRQALGMERRAKTQTDRVNNTCRKKGRSTTSSGSHHSVRKSLRRSSSFQLRATPQKVQQGSLTWTAEYRKRNSSGRQLSLRCFPSSVSQHCRGEAGSSLAAEYVHTASSPFRSTQCEVLFLPGRNSACARVPRGKCRRGTWSSSPSLFPKTQEDFASACRR